MFHKKIDEPKATPPKFGEQNKRNQEPCHEMFWRLVSVVIECFKQHSFNAHNSRTESTGTVASDFTIPFFYFISRIYYRYWENSFYLSSWIYFKIIPFAIWYEHMRLLQLFVFIETNFSSQKFTLFSAEFKWQNANQNKSTMEISKLVTPVLNSRHRCFSQSIQEHVMREIPELKERGISCDCIHFSIKPLQKNVIRTYHYKQLVHAWISGKKNSYCEDNVNQHFFSRVPCREEFVSKFNSKCPCFLCDDMNKIKMGTASALSRYHQV